MDAYDQVRNDVTGVYRDVLEKHQSDSMQEGVGGAGLVPAVSVSGSKPAWLGESARRLLAVGTGVGALAGLALMAWLADESSGAASTAGAFAITSLLVTYLTVAGFGTVAFSIGSGSDAGVAEDGDTARDKQGDTDGRVGPHSDVRLRLQAGTGSPGRA